LAGRNFVQYLFLISTRSPLRHILKVISPKKSKSKAPYQGGSHDEVNEWPNCDEKTNKPGETNQQETQMLPTSQR
jgi:hypothetical protein